MDPNPNVRLVNKWDFAFASAIGNSHITADLPCQDACGVDNNEDFTISVVCDGAGSCEHSHLGAAFVVKECLYRFHAAIKASGWLKTDMLPSIEEWRKTALNTLSLVKDSLDNYSITEDLPVKSMACTVIVVITLNTGLLVTHVGDGRAGYCNEKNQWFHLMTPFHGSEANETVFITSDIWLEDIIDHYIECRVIEDDVKAICLLSDGCEKAAFECNLYDEEKNMFYDPNLPFPPFFKSNVEAIPKLVRSGLDQQEMNTNWKNFLATGNEKLRIESDDKTLVLGVKSKH